MCLVTCLCVSSLVYWQINLYYQGNFSVAFGWTDKAFVSAVSYGCGWRRKMDDNLLWEFQMAGEEGQLQPDHTSELTLTCTQRAGGLSKG